MAENYFPRAEDFDEMGDHLEMIARLLTSEVEIDANDWASIQKAVRTGIAPKIFPVGTQLVANHSVYGDIKLDVVAHNHYESADIKGANTMTLMCHDVVAQVQFDAPEVFYIAPTEMSEGTYCFNLMDGTTACNFTMSEPLAEGGVLLISGNPRYGVDSSEILAYDHPFNQAIPRKYPIEVGAVGNSIGTLGVELNHLDRVFYGSENYKESAIRQFLNSSAPSGEVWSPQTKFDFRPGWLDGLAGFANGMDTELLAVIGKVKVPCRTNDFYEAPDSSLIPGQKYTLEDRFYIPSQREIFGSYLSPIDDGSSQLPYFENATNVERVKYLMGNACTYWLRGVSDRVALVKSVFDTGDRAESPASRSHLGVVPMFNVV